MGCLEKGQHHCTYKLHTELVKWNCPPFPVCKVQIFWEGQKFWKIFYILCFDIIDNINNIARYNLSDKKYRQMVFRSARWSCSRAMFGNPWSNKSEWWLPEGDNPWNLLFSSRIKLFKKMWQIFSNFVALSQYLNFK